MAEQKYIGRAGYELTQAGIDRKELTIPPIILAAYERREKQEKDSQNKK